MRHLGFVVMDNGGRVNVDGGRAPKLNIYGEMGSPTVYGLTKNTISVIKTDGVDAILANQDGAKFRPKRAKSALAIAHGLNIELGGEMKDFISLAKKTDSLYLINKINSKGNKVLWGITRMGAGSLPTYSIGSILTADDIIIKVTPNHDLRKDKLYRRHVPLTSLNTLTIRTDYKGEGYTNRYIQIMLGIAKPLKWEILGVVEKSDTVVHVKVRTEAGEYQYNFSLDSDEPEFLRLTSIILLNGHSTIS